MMHLFGFLMCWTPVLLLALLAVGLKRPALDLSICGTLFTIGLVVFYFNTPMRVVLTAGLDGVITVLPLVLVIFAGIHLSTLLIATGSFKRTVDWVMTGVRDAFHRSILITLGVGNFMEGASVIAEPVVAPMLRAAGVEPTGAAALSIVGYAGLMTLEVAGIFITVLALVTGLPVQGLALASAWLSVPATLAMAACVPVFLPKPLGGLARLFLLLACGLVMAMVALVTAAYVGVSISGMVGGLALIILLVLLGPRGLRLDGQTARDLAPFAFILVVLLLLNTVPWLRNLTFDQLTVKVSLVPIHTITLRPFFSAYLYIFLAFVLAAYLLKVPSDEVRRSLREGCKRGWRAVVATGLFGAMGQIIAYSGYQTDFSQLIQRHNLPWVLAHGLADYTGNIYPLFAPFLGWVGTFLTGYGTASLMLFGQLQVQTGQLMGVSATWLASGLAVGASLGSISSPFKIALAASMCGAVGLEGTILRRTIPLGVAASFFIGLVLWVCL